MGIKKKRREILKKRFQANFSALSKSSLKAFKKPLIQAHQLLKCTFKSPTTLRKSKRVFFSLSKVYLKSHSLIKGASFVFSELLIVILCLSYCFYFERVPKQGKVDPNLESECIGLACTQKISGLAWDS